jgi:hypothetical protein
LSRDRFSLRADCANFFRCASGQAPSASGNVFCLHFRWLMQPRDCTKHVWRVSRHRHGDSRERWSSSLRPRNIAVPSSRPTQTRGCTSACASEAQVRVRGSTRSPAGTFAPKTGAGASVQATAQGQGKAPMGSGAFGDARQATPAAHDGQAEPMVTQFGRRLTCSAPGTMKKGVEIDCYPPWSHVIDRPGSGMGQDGQGLALARFFLQTGERLLARRVGASTADGRFREGPFEIGVANCGA